VLSKHAQSPDRFAAMEKLRADGSEDALYSLAKRFSYVYDKTIEDEQEKEFVCDALVAKGEIAIPAVRRFAREAESLSWPLRVLERICTQQQLLEIVDEILEREEPGYTRDPARKIQLLTWLGEWKGPPAAELAKRIVPYLADFDEGVRFIAADALSHPDARDEATAKIPLLDAMIRPEEESRRIKVRCAEVLAECGWTITEKKELVAPLLSSQLPEFGMNHDKLIKKGK
jgi:hypothetical protein